MCGSRLRDKNVLNVKQWLTKKAGSCRKIVLSLVWSSKAEVLSGRNRDRCTWAVMLSFDEGKTAAGHGECASCSIGDSIMQDSCAAKEVRRSDGGR